jgi:cyclopropane fatty-acyl-phospholipid synthase-like methyltransferase
MKTLSDTYDANYFEHGKALGLSCYENYRWLPDLTIPLAQSLIAELGILKTDTILDFGCAKGYLVKAFRSLGYNASGCDVSEYALSCADAETRPHLHLLKPDAPLPPSGQFAWDWVLAKDVLEHLDKQQIEFRLADFFASSLNVFAAVPLGDGSRFLIPEMEQDVTHVTRERLSWWQGEFFKAGFSHVAATHKMHGVKTNWTDPHPTGNGFLVAS